MKEFIKKTILLFMLLIICISNVKAYDEAHYQEQVKNKEALLLCEYKDSKNIVRARIYYTLQLNSTDGVVGTGVDMYPWHFYYYDEHYKKMGQFHNSSAGTFKSLFIDSRNGNDKLFSYNHDGKTFDVLDEPSFTCPEYINIGYDWYDRVCFADKGKYNGKCDDNGTIYKVNAPLSQSANTIFNELKKFAEEDVYKLLSADDGAGETTTEENVKNKVKKYIADEIIKKYDMNIFQDSDVLNTYIGQQSKRKYKAPLFLSNFANNLAENINPENSKAYDDYRTDSLKELEERKKKLEQQLATTTNEEEKKSIQKEIDATEEKIQKFEDNTPQTYFAKTAQTTIDLPTIKTEKDCSSLLGPTVSTMISNLFKTVQYAGPILVAIFTIMDFIKAVMSGEAEDMKKATNKLVKRLVAAVLLFFVPLLCDLLLDLAGVVRTNNCTFG